MLEQLSADIFQSFIFGAIAVVLGGFIFEGGKRYVKTGTGTQFKGKVEALPFFFGTLVVGYILQFLNQPISSFVQGLPPLTRIGIIGLTTMMLFNYSVSNFNYFDYKSATVYFVSLVIAYYPFI